MVGIAPQVVEFAFSDSEQIERVHEISCRGVVSYRRRYDFNLT